MRSTIAAFAVLTALAVTTPALAEVTVVQIDQSARLTLNAAATSVFTGNPSIADVAIINRNTLMIIGKGYGVTNIVAMDGSGHAILDRQVQVSPGIDGRMTLYRGAMANNFACSPLCERTPMPGEHIDSFQPYETPYENYQKRQSGAGGEPAPTK